MKNGLYYLDVSEKNDIAYNNSTYSVTDGEKAFLRIEEVKDNYKKKKKHKLSGRVIDKTPIILDEGE